jgi:hypothetical protein
MAHPLAVQPACEPLADAPLPDPEPCVYLIVRIPPPQILNLFLALFERFPVRILAVSRATTVQVKVPHSELAMAMDAIMQALPQAEFGAIQLQDSL